MEQEEGKERRKSLHLISHSRMLMDNHLRQELNIGGMNFIKPQLHKVTCQGAEAGLNK